MRISRLQIADAKATHPKALMRLLFV